MTSVVAIGLLALPTALVVLAHVVLRPGLAQLVIWGIVAAIWAAALWFWVDYGRQNDDVGLMVSGLSAMGLTFSALFATVAGMVITWRRRG